MRAMRATLVAVVLAILIAGSLLWYVFALGADRLIVIGNVLMPLAFCAAVGGLAGLVYAWLNLGDR